MKAWAVGVDIGGTFTDVVAVNHNTGSMHSTKVLTTHQDPTLGVIDGLNKLFDEYAIIPGEVGKVVHATTLFTNALIERRGCPTGLLVNEGFKDIIEIGNERKYDLYDVNITKATPLVERSLRTEISARLRADGTEKQPVKEQEIIENVGRLVNKGIESIAICLLHSYANDTHEKKVKDIIEKNYPNLSITISTEIAPVVREFERICTTVANAYIKPLAYRYLADLTNRLSGIGIQTNVLMMLSNGGLTHIEEAARNPIDLLESGPAAGAIAAAYFSSWDAYDELLAFDMGGTTAKLCLVEKGSPSITYQFEAARQKRFTEGSGIPLHITTVDLIEIGAGGGSIAHMDELGLLKVGPQSAGSEPGPACYDRGGENATVTDANLLLGYLNPEFFAGGSMHIDMSLSHSALQKTSDLIGQEKVETAWGVHDIVAENMAGAARVHIAERGQDPQNFVLLCTGGGGPLHSYYVAQKIGVRTIVCPPSAGVASAFGLLVAPARTDRSRSVKIRPQEENLEELEKIFSELEQSATSPLETLKDSFTSVTISRHADGRFVGQGFNLTVKLPSGPYYYPNKKDNEMHENLVHAFEQCYREKFGRTPPNIPVELVNLRVTAEAKPINELSRQTSIQQPEASSQRSRNVYFREVGDYVKTAIYVRSGLAPGFSGNGPMLIEDAASTLVVGPKGHAQVLESGNIIVSISE